MLKKQRTTGFHLLELTFAIALMAVLAAASYPSLRSLSALHLLKSETRRFASLLENLAVEALQREVKIELELNPTHYVVKRPARQDKGSFADPIQVQFQSTEAGHLSFFPSGTATPATFTFSNGEHRCILTLSLRGRVASDCP